MSEPLYKAVMGDVQMIFPDGTEVLLEDCTMRSLTQTSEYPGVWRGEGEFTFQRCVAQRKDKEFDTASVEEFEEFLSGAIGE